MTLSMELLLGQDARATEEEPRQDHPTDNGATGQDPPSKPTTKPSSKLTPVKIEPFFRLAHNFIRHNRVIKRIQTPRSPAGTGSGTSSYSLTANTVVAQIFLLEQGRITPNPEKVAALQQAPKPEGELCRPQLR
uniref:Uncharacterized protein n=1 Tax=Amorphochlora amoebiformis TaxID=1561963 RepID=A0A7S0D8A7_9EUKA|mmetsp:Transcript_21434/g.33851  ORF Transcript_21434/g.33851 Transcript_21434/m.33851 type:complete len:134 (+) Transcript_21434:448-849(+)